MPSPQDQPQAQVFQIQNYVPPGTRVQFLETNGTYQIPHRIFAFMVKVPETKLPMPNQHRLARVGGEVEFKITCFH